jgi:hypothetical protein
MAVPPLLSDVEDRVNDARRGIAVRGRPEQPAPARANPGDLLVFSMVAAVLAIGWRARGEEYLTAESGLGYALGILGAAAMLLLLLYPLRKRVRALHRWGATRHWFRAHMLLGVIGPTLVLFHANFRTEALNSTLAVVSMLLVATSGFVGRYLYCKIHHGLYGRQLSLGELKAEVEQDARRAALLLGDAPGVQRRLLEVDAAVLAPCPGLFQSVRRFVTTGPWTRRIQRRLGRDLERAIAASARREGWSAAERRRRSRQARHHVARHMGAARRVARFTFYERVFALWHLLHLPLFVLLIITMAVHVLAVHLY